MSGKQRQHGMQRQQPRLQFTHPRRYVLGIKLARQGFEHEIDLRIGDTAEIGPAGSGLRRVPPRQLIPRNFEALIQQHGVETMLTKTLRG